MALVLLSRPLLCLAFLFLSEQIEDSVCALPGVASCKLTRLLESPNSGAGGTTAASITTSAYLLTATRHPLAGSTTHPRSRDSAGPRVGGSAGGGAQAAGAHGSGGKRGFASGATGTVEGSAVWDALRDAFDAKGRPRRSGVRDVLEAVRGLGYGATALSGGGGGGSDAEAMEARQVRGDSGGCCRE